MGINWYPGHMDKAQKQLRKLVKEADIIIEVLDARIPYSSCNPLIAEISKETIKLKILNKADIADPVVTAKWVNFFNKQRNIQAITTTGHHPKSAKIIINKIKNLVTKTNSIKPIKAVITGIPNSGKSTIINTLNNKKIAKTGNEPAVTKQQSRINLKNGIIVFDTPGILWPKIENPYSSYRLAATGAIKNTAFHLYDIIIFVINYLMNNYNKELRQRYQLPKDMDEEELILEFIAKKTGAVIEDQAQMDKNKLAETIINDLRKCKIGFISLESPSSIQEEQMNLQEKNNN